MIIKICINNVYTKIILNKQMKKLRLKKYKWIVQGHTNVSDDMSTNSNFLNLKKFFF